jgi:hypothetical protein
MLGSQLSMGADNRKDVRQHAARVYAITVAGIMLLDQPRQLGDVGRNSARLRNS